MVHIVADDAEWPDIARQACGSYSGSYGSLETQNACNDINLPLVHTVLLRLTGHSELIKWRDLHDVDV